MKKALIIAAGLMGLGLLLGLTIRSGIMALADRSRTVTVRGLSEREVEANKVTWPLVYKLTGNDLQQLYAEIASNNEVVKEYLTGNGLNPDEFAINAPDITDNQADPYASKQLYRYSVTSVITVTSHQVDLVRRLIRNQGELLKKGIAVIATDWNYRTIFEYTGLNDVKPEMIADATNKARQAAVKFADDSGSKVGKIMNASQGQFSIEDRDPYTPYVKKVRVVTTLVYAIED